MPAARSSLIPVGSGLCARPEAFPAAYTCCNDDVCSLRESADLSAEGGEGLSLSAGGLGVSPRFPLTSLGRAGGKNNVHVAVLPWKDADATHHVQHPSYERLRDSSRRSSAGPSAPSPFTTSTTCSTIAEAAAPHRPPRPPLADGQSTQNAVPRTRRKIKNDKPSNNQDSDVRSQLPAVTPPRRC